MSMTIRKATPMPAEFLRIAVAQASSLCRRPARRQRAAFTLMEVLVVISVMAILVTLLFPGVRAIVFGSKSQSTRHVISQVEMAINLHRDMRGSYPEMDADDPFCGRKLVEQLGDLLKVRESCFLDTNGDGKLDTVVDAYRRPLIYTRYVATVSTKDPGATNGEGGIQPLYRPTTYEIFSCGAYADLVLLSTSLESYQSKALENNGQKYTHDGKRVTGKGNKPTSLVNRYIGNW